MLRIWTSTWPASITELSYVSQSVETHCKIVEMVVISMPVCSKCLAEVTPPAQLDYLFPRSCLRPDLVKMTGRCKVSSGRRAGRAQYRAERADMSTDIAREESFRTALRNQKRRLSATEKKPVSTEFGPGEWLTVLSSSLDNPTQVWTSQCWEVSRLGRVSPHLGEIFSLLLEPLSPHPGQSRTRKTTGSADRGVCWADNNNSLSSQYLEKLCTEWRTMMRTLALTANSQLQTSGWSTGISMSSLPSPLQRSPGPRVLLISRTSGNITIINIINDQWLTDVDLFQTL